MSWFRAVPLDSERPLSPSFTAAGGFASKSGGAAAPAASRKEPTVPPSGSLFPDAAMRAVLAARGECSPCTPFFFEAKPRLIAAGPLPVRLTAAGPSHPETSRDRQG